MSGIRASVIRKRPSGSLSADYERKLKQVVALAGNEVRNTAVQSIQSHGSSGQTYQKYNPRRTHTAAESGNPPNSDTGYLANNIFLDIKNGGLTAEVESRAAYSAYLEFGWLTSTGRFVQFPFLQPAAEAVRPKVRRWLARIKGKGGLR